MSIYFIGVNCGHNASISIVDSNCNLIFSTDIDRHTKISYDFGYFENEIERAINFLNIKKEQIKILSIHQVWLKDEKIFNLSKRLLPVEFLNKLNFLRSLNFNELNIKKVIFLKNCLLKKFPFTKILIPSHHACHAAAAGFSSPFYKTKIHVVDAYGDELNESVWNYKNKSLKLEKKICDYPNLPHIWELFSRLVFNQYRNDVNKKLEPYMPSKGPGKIMAIASEFKSSEKIENLIFNFSNDKEIYSLRIGDKKIKKKFTKTFNKLINKKNNKNVWKNYGQFAASLQSFTNKELKKKIYYKTDNLCFSGGLALNCVATSFVCKKKKIKNIYTPPFPGDSGISVGAAYLAYEYYFKNKFLLKNFFIKKPYKNLFSPFVGYSYQIRKDFLYKHFKKNFFLTLTFDDNKDLSKFIAVNILKNKIIGLFNDRAEIGPRALCNRSILSNPFNYRNKKIINKLKKRESFRPVAPTVLESCAKKIFKNYFPHSPFMTQVQKLKKKYILQLPGICHSDNTARPQIIYDETESLIKNILINIKNKKGVGIIGNTSFNIEGPIVEKPIQAIELFKKNEIDILILNNYAILKL